MTSAPMYEGITSGSAAAVLQYRRPGRSVRLVSQASGHGGRRQRHRARQQHRVEENLRRAGPNQHLPGVLASLERARHQVDQRQQLDGRNQERRKQNPERGTLAPRGRETVASGR
jgi:hypothetical protein